MESVRVEKDINKTMCAFAEEAINNIKITNACAWMIPKIVGAMEICEFLMENVDVRMEWNSSETNAFARCQKCSIILKDAVCVWMEKRSEMTVSALLNRYLWMEFVNV